MAQQVNNPSANAGDTGDVDLIPVLGRSAGEGNGNPLQYSCLEKSMDREAWPATVQPATVHGVCKESDRSDRVTLVICMFLGKFLFGSSAQF